MADVTLQYQMNDGEVLTANLSTEHNHADALDELATRAVRMLKESLIDIYAISRASEAPVEDIDGDETPEATA